MLLWKEQEEIQEEENSTLAIADSSVVKSTPGAAEEALVLHFLATQFWWNSKVECAVGVDREAQSDAAKDIDDLSLSLLFWSIDRLLMVGLSR